MKEDIPDDHALNNALGKMDALLKKHRGEEDLSVPVLTNLVVQEQYSDDLPVLTEIAHERPRKLNIYNEFNSLDDDFDLAMEPFSITHLPIAGIPNRHAEEPDELELTPNTSQEIAIPVLNDVVDWPSIALLPPPIKTATEVPFNSPLGHEELEAQVDDLIKHQALLPIEDETQENLDLSLLQNNDLSSKEQISIELQNQTVIKEESPTSTEPIPTTPVASIPEVAEKPVQIEAASIDSRETSSALSEADLTFIEEISYSLYQKLESKIEKKIEKVVRQQFMLMMAEAWPKAIEEMTQDIGAECKELMLAEVKKAVKAQFE